jgi:hypothetical protein
VSGFSYDLSFDVSFNVRNRIQFVAESFGNLAQADSESSGGIDAFLVTLPKQFKQFLLERYLDAEVELFSLFLLFESEFHLVSFGSKHKVAIAAASDCQHDDVSHTD